MFANELVKGYSRDMDTVGETFLIAIALNTQSPKQSSGVAQGKRILFLEYLLGNGFADYLFLRIKLKTLAGQGLQNLDAFTPRSVSILLTSVTKREQDARTIRKNHFDRQLVHLGLQQFSPK